MNHIGYVTLVPVMLGVARALYIRGFYEVTFGGYR